MLGLLGPNGPGKTTLVRILWTLLPADAGRAKVTQYAVVDTYLTGPENLRMIGRLSGLDRRGSHARAGYLAEVQKLCDAYTDGAMRLRDPVCG